MCNAAATAVVVAEALRLRLAVGRREGTARHREGRGASVLAPPAGWRAAAPEMPFNMTQRRRGGGGRDSPRAAYARTFMCTEACARGMTHARVRGVTIVVIRPPPSSSRRPLEHFRPGHRRGAGSSLIPSSTGAVQPRRFHQLAQSRPAVLACEGRGGCVPCLNSMRGGGGDDGHVPRAATSPPMS